MFSKSILAALLFATSANAIAKDPISACKGSHKAGSPCKFKVKTPDRTMKMWDICVRLDGEELNEEYFTGDTSYLVCGHAVERGFRRAVDVNVSSGDVAAINHADALLSGGLSKNATVDASRTVAVEFQG